MATARVMVVDRARAFGGSTATRARRDDQGRRVTIARGIPTRKRVVVARASERAYAELGNVCAGALRTSSDRE